MHFSIYSNNCVIYTQNENRIYVYNHRNKGHAFVPVTEDFDG